jgi:hypothetical protein
VFTGQLLYNTYTGSPKKLLATENTEGHGEKSTYLLNAVKLFSKKLKFFMQI